MKTPWPVDTKAVPAPKLSGPAKARCEKADVIVVIIIIVIIPFHITFVIVNSDRSPPLRNDSTVRSGLCNASQNICKQQCTVVYDICTLCKTICTCRSVPVSLKNHPCYIHEHWACLVKCLGIRAHLFTYMSIEHVLLNEQIFLHTWALSIPC